MSRQSGKKNYFNFVGGLNTEASPLNSPPNQWRAGDNMVPELDGTVRIRTGMNLEDGFSWSTDSDSSDTKLYRAYSAHEWKNAGGDGSRTIGVVQRGRYLYFYNSLSEGMSDSEFDTSIWKIDLNTYKAPAYPYIIGTDPVQTASANGKLLVTSVATDPILIGYTDSGPTITQLNVLFRDFQGVDDGLQGADVDTFPTTLTSEHKYNLMNQGWPDAKITAYFSALAKYPNNAQQWFLGKDSSDNFTPSLLDKQEFGKSQAPRGHFLLNAFIRDRGAVSGTAVGSETENFRFETCAFFAGRSWFAGIPNSDKLGAWIFFSQVAFNDNQMGYCYQASDPTSEEANELVASDGGVIVIQGMGAPRRLLPIDRGILVFADNGVWFISGSVGGGFAADSYEVQKITTVGISGPATAVAVEDKAYYWADDGIWQVLKNPQTDVYTAANITQTTIESRYAIVAPEARERAKGAYFLEDKTIFWMYQAVPNADGVTDLWRKDTFICLDLRLGSFYTLTINPLASNSPYIYDFIASASKGTTDRLLQVIDIALDDVIDGSDPFNYVAEEFSIGSGLTTKMKFLTVGLSSSVYKVTWSNFENGVTPSSQAAKFRDWYSYDAAGITYTGFILTGYDTGMQPGGDRKLQGQYITVIMKRTETGIDSVGNPINGGSVMMSLRWDFTDDVVAAKWSSAIEVYRHPRLYMPVTVPQATYNDGYPVIVAKHKMRGRGFAFQVRFESTADKDFKLIGWSIPIDINDN